MILRRVRSTGRRSDATISVTAYSCSQSSSLTTSNFQISFPDIILTTLYILKSFSLCVRSRASDRRLAPTPSHRVNMQAYVGTSLHYYSKPVNLQLQALMTKLDTEIVSAYVNRYHGKLGRGFTLTVRVFSMSSVPPLLGLLNLDQMFDTLK